MADMKAEDVLELREDSFPGLMMVRLVQGGVAYIDLTMISEYQTVNNDVVIEMDLNKIRPEWPECYMKRRRSWLLGIGLEPRTVLHIDDESMTNVINAIQRARRGESL